MKLSKKTISKKEFGDITLIQKSTGLSRPTITKAFDGFDVCRNTFRLITGYYSC